MFEDFFKFQDWVLPDRTIVERWGYRKYKEYPPKDASKEEVVDFIKDAIQAEKKIKAELIASGMSEEEAVKESCQYPLKEDAPMSAIRSWLGYNNWLQDPKNDGIDP